MEWLWGALAAAALAGTGFLIVRVMGNVDAAHKRIDDANKRIEDVEKDLLLRYVRHEHLASLKKTTDLLLARFTALQIALAKKLKLTIVEEPASGSEDEG